MKFSSNLKKSILGSYESPLEATPKDKVLGLAHENKFPNSKSKLPDMNSKFPNTKSKLR